jgi:hypothetical protein
LLDALAEAAYTGAGCRLSVWVQVD